jgi:hypothetical protein
VSLPSDIIQFLGPKSVPVVIAGTVLAVFELGHKFSSQKAKDALSKWLLTFDIQKAKVLPDGTKEFFEKIFGERHFSLKCFIRSALFSLGAIAFISIVCLLINPSTFKIFYSTEDVFGRNFARLLTEWFLALWLPWSIIIDYVSLFKTRFVLWLLVRMPRRTTIIAIAILAMDYIVYIYIFVVGISLVQESMSFIGSSPSITQAWEDLVSTVKFHGASPLSEVSGVLLILFWSGFAPSIWMWLYVLALFVTRLLLRSEKLVNWLRWALDIEKNPFRSIGAVAATLAFIGSLVIILVSAEISWITKVVSG